MGYGNTSSNLSFHTMNNFNAIRVKKKVFKIISEHKHTTKKYFALFKQKYYQFHNQLNTLQMKKNTNWSI